MLISDIKTMLAETGLSATYYSWPEKEAPPLPYLVWFLPGSDNVAADDRVYKKVETLNIELYSATKDFDLENTVEAVLDKYHLVWEREELYLDSERMFEVVYEMQIVINEETNNNG